MKAKPLSRVWAFTADQRDSRHDTDKVPAALAAIEASGAGRWLLPPERTAGDEIQGLSAEPAQLVAAVLALTEVGQWRIGIGLGTVEQPLPESTRAARGEAYLAARRAVEEAGSTPGGLRLAAAGVNEGAGPYRDRQKEAETVLLLMRGLASGRSRQGWEVSRLVDQGLKQIEIAGRLGISASAVSQRLSRTFHEEVRRGAALATRMLIDLQEFEVSDRA